MHTERKPPPARFNFARHILAVNSGRHGKLAYRDDKTELSYGELDQRVRRFAAGLLKQGVQPEQRVLLVMLDTVDLPVAFLGALYAGAVPVPVNTLREFIAYAKANPDKLNYASQGNGSVSHIGTEIFKMQTGAQMTHVPYKGSGQAIADVLAGQVQVFITTPPSVMQHVQTGKLKALAVTGKIRHPGMPQVPTVAEASLSNFELESWVAIYAPAGTPAAVLQKLSGDLKRAMELPETRQRADGAGIEVRYLSPAETTRVLERETADWARAIKAASIRMD